MFPSSAHNLGTPLGRRNIYTIRAGPIEPRARMREGEAEALMGGASRARAPQRRLHTRPCCIVVTLATLATLATLVASTAAVAAPPTATRASRPAAGRRRGVHRLRALERRLDGLAALLCVF